MVVYSGLYRIREGRFAIFGEARKASHSIVTALKAHKSLVKPVQSPVTLPRFPPDFPFPISHFRSQILEHGQIYYLDRYSLSGKWYLAFRKKFDSINLF